MKARDKTLIVLAALGTVLGAALFYRHHPPGRPRASPASAAEVVGGELGATIDGYLATLVDRGFSGTVLLSRNGEVVLHKAYGLADAERRTPLTTETVFDIGSLTKQFTAAAIMKLEMAGKLNTNDSITRHLPDVPADKAAITLHQLLTHTAGLPMNSGGDYAVSRRDETVRRILDAPLQTPPGEAFSYSNPGYSLLAAIVERVSGDRYEAFLRTQLFEPAGMHATGYRLAKWDSTRLARGYMDDRDQGTPLDHQWADAGPYWNLFGNGGMLSTTSDLYRWAQALKGERILTSAGKEKLFTPALKNYAYGWRVAETAHGKHISHGGDSENGFSANCNIYPDKDAVVIVLTNRIPLGDFLFQRRVVNRITPALFGAPLQADPPVKPMEPTR